MIAPQLAKEAEITTLQTFIENDEWIMEQKLDGHRVLLCSPGGDFPATVLTRGGNPYTRGLPASLKDFRFPEGVETMEAVLDGELVDGVLWVFDILTSANSTPSTPLYARRILLETIFATVPEFRDHPAIQLVPQARTKDDKIRLAEKALANNFEGLVLKKRSSPYRSGMRTEEWLKVKFVTTADCFVLDVRDDGKESVKLGMIHWTGPGILSDSYEVREVGRASLIGKEKNGTINKGDVIEVKYLYAGANGRLYQPTILRKRDDKEMFECGTGQLKHVNKEVLETL
jgi:ATP-dependent DNA ligase